jgi:hypothetical protein
MTNYCITSAFECLGGAKTHAFMDCLHPDPEGRMQTLACSRCSAQLLTVSAIRVWTRPTAAGALSLRLSDPETIERPQHVAAQRRNVLTQRTLNCVRASVA